MLKTNFIAYGNYVTDGLTQWDIDRVLEVRGLNLVNAPEVHFSNANMDRAIVRQSTMENHIVTVKIPNSLLQHPLRIYAHIGIYEGSTFKVVEVVEIPVAPRKRPEDYQIEDTDEEVYSFKRLENELANKATKAQVANIIAHNNDTEGNTELVDVRYGADGVTYPSAGEAVREQASAATADAKLLDAYGRSTLHKYAKFTNGGLDAGKLNKYQPYRVASENIMLFDKDITLKIADGFRVGVHTMTVDGVFVSDSSWQVNEYTIPSNTYFKVAIARTTEDTSERANILEYSNAVTFNTFVYDAIGKLEASVKKRKAWLTSAHQGFAGYDLHENSLAAFYNAHLHGADMIEVDARLASDGVLVVNHDATVSGYNIANTPSSTLCSIVLSEDANWGTQYLPTLAQVLHLAYNTGLQVNIDLKDGIASAEAVAKLVLDHGMQGKVVYALNGSGVAGINTIMAIDPDARFIDTVENFTTQLTDFAERGKRCYAYTGYASDVPIIRESGCMVALASLNATRFDEAIACHPDMCEFLHTSDFRAIEDTYFETLKLY